MDSSTADDLRSFERRMVDIVQHMQPRTTQCRLLLAITLSVSAYFTYEFVVDPLTLQLPLFDSLQRHLWFSLCVVINLILFCVVGIHQRVLAPSIVTARCRQVLSDFNMSCDDYGRLILKPRPQTP